MVSKYTTQEKGGAIYFKKLTKNNKYSKNFIPIKLVQVNSKWQIIKKILIAKKDTKIEAIKYIESKFFS